MNSRDDNSYGEYKPESETRAYPTIVPRRKAFSTQLRTVGAHMYLSTWKQTNKNISYLVHGNAIQTAKSEYSMALNRFCC